MQHVSDDRLLTSDVVTDEVYAGCLVCSVGVRDSQRRGQAIRADRTRRVTLLARLLALTYPRCSTLAGVFADFGADADGTIVAKTCRSDADSLSSERSDT